MTPDIGSLEAAVTQQAFGDMVGISQPAVSDLMARGVIAMGQPAGAWILAYCEHLRQVAAGRNPDGRLAEQRTRLVCEQADRVAMQNAQLRAEYIPAKVLEAVLLVVSRQAAEQLVTLVPEVLLRLPLLAGEPARHLRQKIDAARLAMLSAQLDSTAIEVDPGDLDEDDPR